MVDTVPNASARDLFLSFNSFDREIARQLNDRLTSQGISTFYDSSDLVAGVAWIQPLERAIASCGAVAVLIGPRGLGRVQVREKDLALDRQMQLESAGQRLPVIPVLLPGAKPETVPGFLRLNSWVDLRGGLTSEAELSRLISASRGAAITPKRPDICPYLGLSAFGEQDDGLFFGRSRTAVEIADRIREHGLVAVIGESGSGKSSVVQAGVLPILRRRVPPASTWDAVTFTPGSNPFQALAHALVSYEYADHSVTDRVAEVVRLSELLKHEPGWKATFTEVGNLVAGIDHLLIVVDQFEELFTHCSEEMRRSFIDRLMSTDVKVLLTLRATFYAHAIDASRELSEAIAKGTINVGPMTREELRDCIKRPAELTDLTIEDALVERILDDVEEQPGSLPLLEFALTELWRARRDGAVDNHAYEGIGGIQGAIGKHADVVLAAWPEKERPIVLRTLARLVHVEVMDDELVYSRRRIRLRDLDPGAQQILRKFVDARLLVSTRELETDDEIVYVAHETLFYNWKALRSHLDNDRAFLVWRGRLATRMREWRRLSRESEQELRGRALTEAKRWRKQRQADLSPAELDYISRSEGAPPLARMLIFALIMAIIGGAILRDTSDANQVKEILEDAPRVVAEVGVGADESNDWLVALARSGRPAEALRIAQTGHADSTTLAEIAKKAAAARDSETALQAVQLISEPHRELGLYAEVAVLLDPTSAGSKEAVRRALAHLANPGEILVRPHDFGEAIRKLAKVAPKAELEQRARELVKYAQSSSISPDNPFAPILDNESRAIMAAHILFLATNDRAALTLVDGAAPEQRFEPWYAGVLLDLDREERGLEILRAHVKNESFRIAPYLRIPITKFAARWLEKESVATVQQRLADRLELRPYDQMRVLMDALKSSRRAEEICPMLDEAFEKYPTGAQFGLVSLAIEQAHCGRERILKLIDAERLTGSDPESVALIALFDLPRALELAKTLDESGRKDALTKAGRLASVLGDHERALDLADAIKREAESVLHLERRSSLLQQVGKLYARAGELARARSIADECAIPGDRLAIYAAMLDAYREEQDQL